MSQLDKALADAIAELQQFKDDYETAKQVYDPEERDADFDRRWQARIDRITEDIRALRSELE